MTTEETAPEQPGIVTNPVPVKIHLKSGKVFIVKDIDAWGYTDEGVFATGYWKGYTGETDILVPYDSIEFYELGFDLLKRFIQQEAAANESPSA